MSRQSVIARALAISLLLFGVFALSSFGDLCDNDCRERTTFYIFNPPSIGSDKLQTEVYDHNDCLYCEHTTGACLFHSPAELGDCRDDKTYIQGYTGWNDGYPYCDEVKGLFQYRNRVQGVSYGKNLGPFPLTIRYRCILEIKGN